MQNKIAATVSLYFPDENTKWFNIITSQKNVNFIKHVIIINWNFWIH